MTFDPPPGGCSRVVDLLADYLEDRLPPRMQAELDAHLGACGSCVAQLRTYRATTSLLRGLCDKDLPPELRETAESFLEDQTRH